MQITIAPAGLRTGAATIRELLSLMSNSVKVQGLYCELDKVPAEFNSHDGFLAVKGDVCDGPSLDFAGSDAVLAIIPPINDGRDPVDTTRLISNNIRDAIERAISVKLLVLLSSVGAQYQHGVGEVKTNMIAEVILSNTMVQDIVIVRHSYPMENWAANMNALNDPVPFFYSTITPLNWKVPMVAIRDVGHALATRLLQTEPPTDFTKFIELRGPKSYTPMDVQQAFIEALGREVAVLPVEEAELTEFYAHVPPAVIVGDWFEIATGFLPGGIMTQEQDVPDFVNIIYGKTELVDALRAATAGLRDD